jgi:hypothetical protein
VLNQATKLFRLKKIKKKIYFQKKIKKKIYFQKKKKNLLLLHIENMRFIARLSDSYINCFSLFICCRVAYYSWYRKKSTQNFLKNFYLVNNLEESSSIIKKIGAHGKILEIWVHNKIFTQISQMYLPQHEKVIAE